MKTTRRRIMISTTLLILILFAVTVLATVQPDSFLLWANSACSLALVPKTGQTTSYAPFDDGALKTGVTWPEPRFTANIDNNNDGDCDDLDLGETCDGTVTDNLTGLIWLKWAGCFGWRVWATALSDAKRLRSGWCGLNDGSQEGDWWLPNVRELQSLVDYGQDYPALPNGHPFTGVLSPYWSNTTYTNNPNAAWSVYFASTGRADGILKTSSAGVWPVRGTTTTIPTTTTTTSTTTTTIPTTTTTTTIPTIPTNFLLWTR